MPCELLQTYNALTLVLDYRFVRSEVDVVAPFLVRCFTDGIPERQMDRIVAKNRTLEGFELRTLLQSSARAQATRVSRREVLSKS